MTRAHLVLATLLLAVAVSVSVWPSRSRYLFSWDSANYAFAVDRIDISLHRPHPPGYLGYVFAGRALRMLTRDVNTAFVSWNVLVLPIGALVTALLGASAGLRPGPALSAAVLLVTSPLVWFYACVAEIYVSELLWAATIACTAHLALRGRATAMYWCVGALAAAALFKMTTTLLMLPAAAYAWHQSPAGVRLRASVLLLALLAIVAAVFLTAQHGYVAVIWQQFLSATVKSRLIGPDAASGVGVVLNRNARDTLTALLGALGLVNTVGLAAWALVDRRGPPALGGRFAMAWAAPWLVVFIAIHVGKPGYVLPLLPLVFIVLAGFYSRHGRTALAMAISVQLLANVLYVVVLTPGTPDSKSVRYRDKSVLERLESDLRPLAFPTLATLRQSDGRIGGLLALGRSRCPSGEWVGVAGTNPIDWRRTMYYLPSARVIRLLPGGEMPAIGNNGEFQEVARSGTSISSECGLLWIDDATPALKTAAPGQRVDGLGWVWPAGSGRVTPDTIVWTVR